MKRNCSILLAVTLVLAACTGSASATCGIQGSIQAEQTPTGWIYCISFEYQILDPFATVSLFLPECQSGCDSTLVGFPRVVGSYAGWLIGVEFPPINEPCARYVQGRFHCDGDPALNAPRQPTLTWTPVPGDCIPHLRGAGHVCFETTVAPSATREQTNAITIRTTLGQCWGTLEGRFPGCTLPTPARSVTWSGIKGARHPR